MNVSTRTRTEFIRAWVVAELVEIGIRVLTGVIVFAVSAVVVILLGYIGLNLSQKIQIALIVTLSAVLFWIVTGRFSKRDSSFWRHAARG